MTFTCLVRINGKVIKASSGMTLLDAALGSRIAMPHDCCTGQCDTCRVNASGGIDGTGTREGDTVLACQARIIADAEVSFEEVPEVVTRTARVESLQSLSSDIAELVISLERPLRFLPGQYVKLTSGATPERDYSPTFGLAGEADERRMHFHIRRYPDGLFSSKLGISIRAGSKLKIRGPFGHAWLRQGKGQLVLVSSGTGFAPIWSIAVAACLGQPDRPLTVIAGASDPNNLYMRSAFDWLARRGVQHLELTASGAGLIPEDVRRGRPTEALPRLSPDDVVHAAGQPDMVQAVKSIAAASGASCYADAFSLGDRQLSLRNRLGAFVLRRFSRPHERDLRQLPPQPGTTSRPY